MLVVSFRDGGVAKASCEWNLLIEMRGDVVPVRAVVAQRTVSLHVGFACWPVGVETELVLFPQEIAEVKCV